MKTLRRAWRRIGGSLWKRNRETDLAEEFEFHVQMQTEENIRAGMSPDLARREAGLKFGSAESVRETWRDADRLPVVETLLSDLRFAFRNLKRNSGFAGVAITTLALGIGATTAVFSIINAVFLKPMPIFEPNGLVLLISNGKGDSGEDLTDSDASPAKFQHWRAQTDILEDVSAFAPASMNYTGGSAVEQLRSMQVSSDFFRCWGEPILQGRGFSPQEDLPNGPRVVLISQSLWARHFQSGPFQNKSISLDGEPYSVLGVVPDRPDLPELGSSPEVYVPFQLDPATRDEGNFFKVSARLKPGVTLAQANARLRLSVSEYRQKLADNLGPDDYFSVLPFRSALAGDTRPVLLILLSAVACLLMIACANVANLLLAKASGRRREIAIRSAIGAGRRRIIRQLVTESLLLAVAGGALGALLGFVAIRALLSVNTADLPFIGPNGSAVVMDWRVLAFSMFVSLGTGVIFGIYPAINASRVDLSTALKEGSGQLGGAFRQNRVRSLLVVSETGLAVVLLIGSTLLIRSFLLIYQVDRGIDTHDVLTMQTSMTGPKYTTATTANVIRSAVGRIGSIPGVVTTTTSCSLPLQGGCGGLPFQIVGKTFPPEMDVDGRWTVVSPDFFDVFMIPVKRGRVFIEQDGNGAQPVVVISESMARAYWKDGDPLKDQLLIGGNLMKEFKDEPPRQIIGIVGDVNYDGLRSNGVMNRAIYVLQAQLPDAQNALLLKSERLTWAIRTLGDPHRFASVIRQELEKSIGLPASEILSMDDIASRSMAKQRFNVLLMTVFGCAALLLAVTGVYALMAYTVEQRTREIGIRMALGAGATEIRNMVVWQGMKLALSGTVLGVVAASGLSRVMEALLFGVKPQDPITFVLVSVALIIASLVAAWVPAARALRVDPVTALRHD